MITVSKSETKRHNNHEYLRKSLWAKVYHSAYEGNISIEDAKIVADNALKEFDKRFFLSLLDTKINPATVTAEGPGPKPKKLIRSKITEKLKPGEWETIDDLTELNRLYAIKIQEELEEVRAAKHNDINEFADLVSIAFAFGRINGFSNEEIIIEARNKEKEKGEFGKLVLNNLNPNNPSNALYFETIILPSNQRKGYLGQLAYEVIRIANAKYDGHFSLFSFTTHYKGALGGFPYNYHEFHSWLEELPEFKKLDQLLISLIEKETI